MTDKPVSVTLEDDDGQNVHVVHECDTIQQAEEWIAERGETDRERVQAGKYGIDAPEGMMDDYAAAANQPTEVPPEAEKALNDIATLRLALDRLLTAVDDSGIENLPDAVLDAMNGAEDALDVVTGSETYPELTTFDELMAQARQELLDWIEGGKEPMVLASPVKLMEDGRSDIQIAVPLRAVDAAHFLRRVATEAVNAIGFGPESFGVPGLREIMWRLDYLTKVPTPEEYGADTLGDGGIAYRALNNAVRTREEMQDHLIGGRIMLMPRSSVQLVAQRG